MTDHACKDYRGRRTGWPLLAIALMIAGFFADILLTFAPLWFVVWCAVSVAVSLGFSLMLDAGKGKHGRAL